MTERDVNKESQAPDDGTEAAVRQLAAAAGLSLEDDDIARLIAVARENRASARRLADLAARWDEPAYGLPSLRPRGICP